MPHYKIGNEVFWFDTDAEKQQYQPSAIAITDIEAKTILVPAKTLAQIATELEQTVDRHIELVAHADRWESRTTCTMRAGYPGPWQNKAIAFGQWMDTCYAHCIQVQNDVVAGTRPVPTEAQLIAELPIMVWPV